MGVVFKFIRVQEIGKQGSGIIAPVPSQGRCLTRLGGCDKPGDDGNRPRRQVRETLQDVLPRGAFQDVGILAELLGGMA